MKRLALALPLLVLLAAPAQAATLLRLDGIGPLKLGMSRMAALDTNWLSGQHSGCPLGGKPYPIDYGLKGSAAPAGITGSAEFTGGKLTDFALVTRYRNAGYRVSARYETTFAGTFVSVKRKHGGPQVIGAFSDGKVIHSIGVPDVPICE